MSVTAISADDKLPKLVRLDDRLYQTWGVERAAEYLRVHVDTLYEMARSGEVPACKVGRSWVFVPRLLAEYVEKKCQSLESRRNRAGEVRPSLAERLRTQLERRKKW